MAEAYLCEGLQNPDRALCRRAGPGAARRHAGACHPRGDGARPGLPGHAIDDVLMGCANQAGEDNRNVARMAVLLAGLPETCRRRRSTGCAARASTRIGTAARAIRAGEAEVILAGGVESMTRAPLVMPKAGDGVLAPRPRSTTRPSAGASSTRC